MYRKKKDITIIKRLLSFLFFIEILCAFSTIQITFSSIIHPTQVLSATVERVKDAQIASPSAEKIIPVDPLTKITPTTTEDFCLDVPVLMYHYIKPLPLAEFLGHAQLTTDSDWFDKHMQYLVANGYKTISADDLVKALLLHQQLPQKSVVITIDDGYDDIYDFAYPIAKKHHVILNIMVPTGLIGKSNYLTWDKLQELSKSDLIKIYNHTTTHAPLTYISSAEAEQEIVTAQDELKSKLQNNSTIFTYPYGLINDEVIGLLKRHGYIAAFSTIGGREQCVSTIMKLPRVRVGNQELSEYGF